MNWRNTLVNMRSRFNAMSLRERALMSIAALAVVVLLWDQLLMNPLREKQTRLTQQVGETRDAIKVLNDTIEGRATGDPLANAMAQRIQLQASLAAVDAELQATSAGLIPPQRMVEALREVLQQQRSVRLISMRNLPVTSLVPPATDVASPANTSEQPSSGASARASMSAAPATGATRAAGGPYVHSLELTVEGGYLDILLYLQKVEALPWKFYWQVMELKTDYPVSRARIQLNTLSMEREWLGV